MNWIIRIVATLFAIGVAWIGMGFTSGVEDQIDLFTIIFWLTLGGISQIGVFLSTIKFNFTGNRLVIMLFMLPFYIVIVGAMLDKGFISRLVGSPRQMTFAFSCL